MKQSVIPLDLISLRGGKDGGYLRKAGNQEQSSDIHI